MNGLGPLAVHFWRLWSFGLGVVSIRTGPPAKRPGDRPGPKTLHMEPAHLQDSCVKKLFNLETPFSLGTGAGGRGEDS